MGNAAEKRRRAAAHNASATGTITVELTRLERVHTHNFLMQMGPAAQKRVGWDEMVRINDLQDALHADEIEGAPKPTDTETSPVKLSLRDAEWLVAQAREFQGHAGAFARGLVPAVRNLSAGIEEFRERTRNGEPADAPLTE